MFVHKRLKRPSLECLEARWVPATIKLVGGNLFISNLAGGTGLEVKATATPGKFDVTDNGKLVTVGRVGSLISITGTNAADKVTLDLAGNTFGGGLLVNTGNGSDTVTIDGISAAGGTLGGSASINLGAGDDSVTIGAKAGSIAIGGSLAVNGGLGNNSLLISKPTTTGTTRVGGNLTVTSCPNVQLGPGDPAFKTRSVVVSGSLSVNNASVGSLPQSLQAFYTTTRSINYQGSAGNTDIILATSVTGNTSLRVGDGKNSFGLGGGKIGLGNYGGSVTYTAGNGVNQIIWVGGGSGATVGGNVNFCLGSGDNITAFDPNNIVNGNLLIQAGNGVNSLKTDNMTVAGTLSLVVGNGNNLLTLSAASTIGGTVNVLTGKGNNTLTLMGAQTYQANIRFGTGDDSLELNNASLVLNGYVNGDGGSNTLTQTLGTLSPTLTLVGF